LPDAVSHRSRLLFVIALWASALVAPLLMVATWIDPVLGVDLAALLAASVAWTLLTITVGSVALALLWPPFLPGLRVAMRRTMTRAGIDQGPLREAVAKLQHLETAQAHLDVARIAAQLGNDRQALPHAVKAVELDPELTSARFLLSQVLDGVGQRQEAVRQCRIVLRDEPDHAFGRAMIHLGECLLRDNDLAGAIETLEQHARLHGATRASAFTLGEAHQRAGNRDASLRWFAEAARNPAPGEHLAAADALVRARARVRLWGRGRPAAAGEGGSS